MQLKNIQITEYKSIRDSNEVDIDDVTCFVGKNEAGKTALLEAIYRLNPIIESDAHFHVTDDYPRVDVEDYEQEIENGADHTTVIEAQFDLSGDEVAEIESQFGKGVLKKPSFTLSRSYKNILFVNVAVNDSVAIGALIARHELSGDLKKSAKKCKSLQSLATHLDQNATAQTEAVAAATNAANQLQDEAAKAKALSDAKSLGESSKSQPLRNELSEIAKQDGLSLHIWCKHIKANVPKFLYFDEYYQMQGHLNIEKLKERQAAGKLLNSDRPMLGLIDLARLDLDKLLNPDSTESLINKLEGTSNHLSKQVLKYWSQNKHLQVKFDVRPAKTGDPEGMQQGTNLWGRVHDSVHYVSTQLGTRSKGFVWFFSFLAWFSQQKKNDNPLILLLDEPGLFLHAKAQGDLLRYIEEELKPHHQVIYTTHSPFMIDPQHFGRVRIVEDRSMDADNELPKAEQGSKVTHEVLEVSADSLFPLQGALGYDIAQSLFVGPNCLIVEGVSDLLYLQAISEVLRADNRIALSDKWTITPVGGSDKVPTFVALLGTQKRIKLATLIDIQDKDRQKVEQLYKKKLLKKKNVLTFGDFTNRDEADIEDMFDVDFYLQLVNSEYAAELSKPIAISDLPSTDQRILVRLEEYLKTNPLKKGSFNHYRPARYFVENTKTLKGNLSKDTLDRFEAAAKVLNALLK